MNVIGLRIAGVVVTLAGIALFLLGVVMVYGPASETMGLGVAVTAIGGAIIGWSLRRAYVLAGALVGGAGIAGIAISNLGVVPRDASAFFLGGIEAAAFGIGVIVGGFRVVRWAFAGARRL